MVVLGEAVVSVKASSVVVGFTDEVVNAVTSLVLAEENVCPML